MTEQMSGKLPVEKPQPTVQPVVIARLGSNTAAVYDLVSTVAEQLAEFAAKLSVIADRLKPMESDIQEISDGNEE